MWQPGAVHYPHFVLVIRELGRAIGDGDRDGVLDLAQVDSVVESPPAHYPIRRGATRTPSRAELQQVNRLHGARSAMECEGGRCTRVRLAEQVCWWR